MDAAVKERLRNKLRLRYSNISTLETCERKFFIEELTGGQNKRPDTADTVFGTAFGAAVVVYFVTQDPERALFTAWKEYFPIIESEKKRESVLFALLQRAFPVIDSLLLDYEPVSFNGKPAAELSFCIESDDFYYTGFVDFVLYNRKKKRYVVFECKTTGLTLENLEPVYANSQQTIGYSIVLDAVTGQKDREFEVLYFVGQLGKNPYESQIKLLPFTRTDLDRLDFFISLGLDSDRIKTMRKINVWPKRGASCLKYNKPCYHFQTCGLKQPDEQLPVFEDIDWQFHFQLEDLVQTLLSRVNASL